jgi:Nuclease-related domain/UvrD-like helicase C-terminal domain/AAA domain
MGLLVPEDFPMSLLANDEERVVVRALCDRLTDGWLVIPDVGLTGQPDRQMDMVIAHAHEGIAVIEVKGHRVSISGGLWCSHGRPLDPQPLAQARENAYELRRRLRRCSQELAHVQVEYAVAFPNSFRVVGDLPPDADPSQVLLTGDLETPQDAIDRLMDRRFGGQRIGAAGIEALVKYLRPDAELRWDPEARARLARIRLEMICADQVRALEELDANRKVVVTGAAGTGKTRLAMAWARRALARNERVLLTCYNDPLGDDMRSRLRDDRDLVVGSFFDVALAMEGLPPLEVPVDADRNFWDTVAIGHMHSHWRDVTESFDTIVIDEAQDFSPTWITHLTQLLGPLGPRRMLMVADEAQSLYPRGFTLPSVDDGWTRCKLVNNCRNTFDIASMLCRRLGGAPAPVGGPESVGVEWVEADETEAVVKSVGDQIDRIEGEGHEPPRVLVATFSTQLRDRLRAAYAFVPWERGESDAIICENVHRVKGLEFDYVILAATAADAVTDALLYVGVSRAIAGLTVVGPRAIAERLGLGRPASHPRI